MPRAKKSVVTKSNKVVEEPKVEEVKVEVEEPKVEEKPLMFNGKKVVSIVGEKNIGGKKLQVVKCEDGATYDMPID